MLLVSVLMPAYNAEKYIGESIESILNQTFVDFEFIIIDDCSTDSTWSIIEEYAKKDSRIRISRNENNLNIAGNRNKLLNLAMGEYIVWQDADDISAIDRIEKQVAFMNANLDVGICGGYLDVFNDMGTIGIRKYPLEDNQLKRIIFKISPIAQPAAMLRKKAIDDVGGFDIYYPPAEDLDLTFRIGQKRKIANIPEILLRYRDNDGNVTNRKLYRMETATLSIRFKYDGFGDYKMTWGDRLYQFAHLGSMFIMSSKCKIKLYNFIRKFM